MFSTKLFNSAFFHDSEKGAYPDWINAFVYVFVFCFVVAYYTTSKSKVNSFSENIKIL